MTPRQLAMFLGVSGIWGASYLLIKIALDGFDAPMIVFTRVALAAGLLLAVIFARGGEDRAALDALRERRGQAIVQGVLSVALPFLLISYGETQISSGLTGILVSPGSLFVAMFAPFIDPSERVDRRTAAGLVIGFAGVIVLLGGGATGTLGELLGALSVLGAACSYGLGAMYAKLKFRGAPPLVVSFASCVTAAILVAPIAAATLPGTSPDVGELVAVATLGLVGTAFAFVLYYSLIAEIGAGRASLVGYLIPPAALAYGVLLLHEALHVAALAGLVLILLGTTLGGGEREVEGSESL